MKFGDSEGKAKRETETAVIIILPSFLLKSLQFIFLLCQRRLQVQVASIMGQLKGTVVRLDGKETKLNIDMSSIPKGYVIYTLDMKGMLHIKKGRD